MGSLQEEVNRMILTTLTTNKSVDPKNPDYFRNTGKTDNSNNPHKFYEFELSKSSCSTENCTKPENQNLTILHLKGPLGAEARGASWS
jgi:hypothetical protein